MYVHQYHQICRKCILFLYFPISIYRHRFNVLCSPTFTQGSIEHTTPVLFQTLRAWVCPLLSIEPAMSTYQCTLSFLKPPVRFPAHACPHLHAWRAGRLGWHLLVFSQLKPLQNMLSVLFGYCRLVKPMQGKASPHQVLKELSQTLALQLCFLCSIGIAASMSCCHVSRWHLSVLEMYEYVSKKCKKKMVKVVTYADVASRALV